jgi:hypothetical protein
MRIPRIVNGDLSAQKIQREKLEITFQTCYPASFVDEFDCGGESVDDGFPLVRALERDVDG